MVHEGQRLIITNAKFAGAGLPGEPTWVDADYAQRLVDRGSARFADNLSSRKAPTKRKRKAKPTKTASEVTAETAKAADLEATAPADGIDASSVKD